MIRIHWNVVAAGLLALAVGCAHNEDKKTATPLAAARPEPARAAPQPQPRPPETVHVISKNKEGDAIYFDFDSSALREDARPVLQTVAESARGAAKAVHIEGNCDELGTIEYNLALGDQRARAAKEYLVRMGVPAEHITTVSFGSQHPKYPGHDEEDRARNRRDDLKVE